jgi:hypothetical protein
MPRIEASSRFAAVMCFLSGAYPLGIGLGIIPVEPGSLHAPKLIVVMAGVLFWLAAVSLLFGTTRARVNNFMGAIMLALFALIGGWVAVFGTRSVFGGGIPFLAMSVYAFVLFARTDAPDERAK